MEIVNRPKDPATKNGPNDGVWAVIQFQPKMTIRLNRDIYIERISSPCQAKSPAEMRASVEAALQYESSEISPRLLACCRDLRKVQSKN